MVYPKLLLAVLIVISACAAQITPAALEKKIPELMQLGDVPGTSVALIGDSKIVWSHGFGVKSAATKEPVDQNTIFEAASLTKPTVAYAALKLVDQGKLDLDTPLSTYLPAPYILEQDDKEKFLRLITARHVLSHTTGFPNWRPDGKPLKVFFTPGERFSYSGEGFVYLGLVMERITGKLLQTVVRELTFEPLGMKDSSLVWEEKFNAQTASGHNVAGAPRPKGKPLTANAAASLQTTANDYARFMIAVMNGTGLKPATARAMLTEQIKVDDTCSNCTDHAVTKRSDTIGWGLGVGLEHSSRKAGDAFWHWGDNGSFRCLMVGYPAQKKGIILFTNSNSGLSIAPQIAELAMGEPQPLSAWLHYPAYDSLVNNMYHAAEKDGIDAAVKLYRADPSKPDESQINNLGYRFLVLHKNKDAIEIFKLNVEAHPDSANVYDSLGEAYMLDHQTELAIKNYEKALAMNPQNSGAAEALKKLRAGS